jgi:hypothetical protein
MGVVGSNPAGAPVPAGVAANPTGIRNQPASHGDSLRAFAGPRERTSARLTKQICSAHALLQTICRLGILPRSGGSGGSSAIRD